MMAAMIELGSKFYTFDILSTQLKKFQELEQVQLWARDSRTVMAAAKRTKRKINPALVYSEVTYFCVFGGRKSSKTQNYSSTLGCPFKIRLAASLDGYALVVKEICLDHNHEPGKKLLTESRQWHLNKKKRLRKIPFEEGNNGDLPLPDSKLGSISGNQLIKNSGKKQTTNGCDIFSVANIQNNLISEFVNSVNSETETVLKKINNEYKLLMKSFPDPTDSINQRSSTELSDVCNQLEFPNNYLDFCTNWLSSSISPMLENPSTLQIEQEIGNLKEEPIDIIDPLESSFQIKQESVDLKDEPIDVDALNSTLHIKQERDNFLQIKQERDNLKEEPIDIIDPLDTVGLGVGSEQDGIYSCISTNNISIQHSL